MTDLTDTLPDLMRRATDGLEPDTPELVARGMRQGVRLCRRRTAGIAVAATLAVTVSAGAVTFATTRGGPAVPDGAPVAGSVSSSPAPPERSTVRPPAGQAALLATLRAVLPKDLRVSEPKTEGDNLLYNQATLIAADDRGSALVEVVVGWKSNHTCRAKDAQMTCTRLPDGSALTTIVTPGGKYDNYVKSNHVRLFRSDGTFVMLTSTNTHERSQGPATRPTPVLSISQLKGMIQDPRWTPPPRRPGTVQDNDLDPPLRGHR